MRKRFRSGEADQLFLLPPCLRDWLPAGHLAYFIVDLVGELDLSALYASYEGEARGQPPYDPALMTALLLYGYCVGVSSSREIERRTHEDVAFRVVACNQHPDHDSICAFRKRHLRALQGLFVQTLRLCAAAGLVKLGEVALDGTVVGANASRHKAMSYGRMRRAEAALQAQVAALFERAERVDGAEDGRYGRGRRGDELPEELRQQESRLRKIRQAREALEAEASRQEEERVAARQQACQAGGEAPRKGRGGRPRRKGPPPGVPPDRAQWNFTDPDSRILLDRATRSFTQGYNAQVAVDAATQVIVAAGVTQSASDVAQMVPLLSSLQAHLERLPRKVTADAGYASEANLAYLQEAGVDGYVAVEKMKHSHGPPPVRGRPPKGLSLKQRMGRKLRTHKGRKTYARRKAVVEPVFGQIKQGRGLRRFLLRGFHNVCAEWHLWCTTHNLLKLYRSRPLPAA